MRHMPLTFVGPNEERRRGAKTREEEKDAWNRVQERGTWRRKGSKAWDQHQEVPQPTTLRTDTYSIEERWGNKVIIDARMKCPRLQLRSVIAINGEGTAPDGWRKISDFQYLTSVTWYLEALLISKHGVVDCCNFFLQCNFRFRLCSLQFYFIYFWYKLRGSHFHIRTPCVWTFISNITVTDAVTSQSVPN